MIARSWHGRVPTSKADAYYAYLLRTGLPDYRATPGNCGVYVFRRSEGEVTHYLLTTLWESYDAIRAFAGPDYERARYYPEDDAYLLEREPLVTHYEVLTADGDAVLAEVPRGLDRHGQAMGRGNTVFGAASEKNGSACRSRT